MDLQNYVKEALIAIQKGSLEANAGQTKASVPISYKEGAQGIEFDLAVAASQGKLKVVSPSSAGAGRIRFFVPIEATK